jgi:hypothetical protein
MTENPTTTTDNRTEDDRSFMARFIRIGTTDILRLVFLSVLVGFLLAAFQIDPRSLWVDFFGSLGDIWSRFIQFLTHSAADLINYFLLGAVIVLPIALLMRVLRATRSD